MHTGNDFFQGREALAARIPGFHHTTSTYTTYGVHLPIRVQIKNKTKKKEKEKCNQLKQEIHRTCQPVKLLDYSN